MRTYSERWSGKVDHLIRDITEQNIESELRLERGLFKAAG